MNNVFSVSLQFIKIIVVVINSLLMCYFYVTPTEIKWKEVLCNHIQNAMRGHSLIILNTIFSFFFSNYSLSERRYGCYRLGVFVAIIIVLLLILGTIPVTIVLKNNQIVLICLCSTLLVVAILLSVFCVWQQKQVKRQRAHSSLPYIIRQNKVTVWPLSYIFFFFLLLILLLSCSFGFF